MLEGIVIERYKGCLYFSNPGTMLIPVESFYEEGHFICRNAILQKMFIAIGRGEHLGSGANIIKKGWKGNGWPAPEVKEHFGANTDRVELTLCLGVVSTPVTEQNSGSSVTNAAAIKEVMRRDPKITHKRMADAPGLSERGAEKITKKLRESGEIHRRGGSYGCKWEVLK